ncbi:MAG: TetR family transcriptional regulator [Pseudomonadota bacterium]
MTERLTREHWIDVALRELAEHGHRSLTANRLAAVLGVSRGSFYWHFQNIEDFETAVLERWRALATDAIIEETSLLEGPEQSLATLIQNSLSAETRLERAVRCWTNESKRVAGFVRAMDAKRVAYVRQLLIAMGVDDATADMRAQVLYWASAGMIMGPVSDQQSAISEQELIRFFAQPDS